MNVAIKKSIGCQAVFSSCNKDTLSHYKERKQIYSLWRESENEQEFIDKLPTEFKVIYNKYKNSKLNIPISDVLTDSYGNFIIPADPMLAEAIDLLREAVKVLKANSTSIETYQRIIGPATELIKKAGD